MRYSVAVVGATGLVGGKMLEVLSKNHFPVDNLTLFASPSSQGKKIKFDGSDISVTALTAENVEACNADIAFFAAGGEISARYAPIFCARGTTVIDNSSRFRTEKDVPLVVPEVNGRTALCHRGLIANPNCSTIQSVVAIAPIYRKYGVKRIIYNTYQSVSGAGYNGLNDLENGTCNAFKYPITNNLLPQIDDFVNDGYTKEEWKMINETRRILDCQNLPVTATAVRVPIKYCHGVSIYLETEKEFDIDDVRKTLASGEGIEVRDNPIGYIYPMPKDACGKYKVYVGRIRADNSIKNGLHLFTVADNLYKGAAANAVQIAEYLIANNAIRATENNNLGD